MGPAACRPGGGVEPGGAASAERSIAAAAEGVLGQGELKLGFDRQRAAVVRLYYQGSQSGEPEEVLDFLDTSKKVDDFRLGTLLLAFRTSEDTDWRRVRTSAGDSALALAGETALQIESRPADAPLAVKQSWELEEHGLLWRIEVENLGDEELELGELGLPLLFNNDYYSDFSQSDEGMTRLFRSRFYVHKYIAGASSYITVTRLNGQMPALLLFPTGSTQLEFTHQILGGWEGIPVVYVFSKATRDVLKMEQDWINGHRSLVIPAGERRAFHFRFELLTGKKHYQGNADLIRRAVRGAMLDAGETWVESHPGMVLPLDNPATVLAVSESEITTIRSEPPADIELLQKAERFGLWRIRFRQTGEHRIEIMDGSHRPTYLHYRIVPPLQELIDRRADFIATRQVFQRDGHVLDGAILVYDNVARQPLVLPSSYWGGGGYEGGITDALFLAAKNARRPDPDELRVLESYVSRFLLGKLQNPLNHEVAWFFLNNRTPYKIGRPYNYMHVVNFHREMYHIARRFGLPSGTDGKEYLVHAAETALAMFRRGWRWHLQHVGFMHFSTLYEMLPELRAEGLGGLADRLETLLRQRGEVLLSREFPYSAEPLYDTTGYEDVYFTGKFLRRFDHMERTLDCAMAQKAFVPTWFWSGSDKRYWDAMENNPAKEYYGTDHGETALHYTTTQTALIGLEDFEHPRFFPQETVFQKSYAGLLGVWALVQEDGSASMCYTPDPASNHYGFNRYSGDVGLGLFGYLRAATFYIDQPFRSLGSGLEIGYGCRVEQADPRSITVIPTDGLGVRFAYPRLRVTVSAVSAMMRKLTLQRDLSQVVVAVANPASGAVQARLRAEGLWGDDFRAETTDGEPLPLTIRDGVIEVTFALTPGAEKTVRITSGS